MNHKIITGLLLIFLSISLFLSNNPTQSQTPDTPLMIISGAEEIVIDWTTDRCANIDIPDLAARAFRSADGQVHLIATHYEARQNVGTDLNSVKHDCTVIKGFSPNADPALYADHEWLASFYTEDGQTIYAAMHNEYQGHTHPSQCPSGEYFNCWYNALTMAISMDGGASFERIAEPPNHLIGTLPYVYEPEAGPYGMFEPSNMISGSDGYIYMYARIDAYKSDEQWVCLLRTDEISQPSAWRAWDGKGFGLAMPNPYVDTIDNTTEQTCAPIDPSSIGVMESSITYNTYLEKYVLVGLSADQVNGRETWGIYYAFSDDLLHWSHRQLLQEMELPWTYTTGDDNPILYPSIIDDDSPSIIFDTTDQTAYLYYTKFNYENNQMTLDRDLVRVPVEFYRSELEATAPEKVTHLTAQVDDSGTSVSGTLTNANGDLLANQRVELLEIPTTDEMLAFTLTGTVPANAQKALVGFRVNTECNCLSPTQFNLYSITFTQDGSETNLVPNNDFADDLNLWGMSGSGSYQVITSNHDDGQMLSVQATETQNLMLNSSVFNVEANTEFTATFTAQIYPETQDGGYFFVIFNNAQGEISRETLAYTPNIMALGQSTTNTDGEFTFSLDTPLNNSELLEVRFIGDDDFYGSYIYLDFNK